MAIDTGNYSYDTIINDKKYIDPRESYGNTSFDAFQDGTYGTPQDPMSIKSSENQFDIDFDTSQWNIDPLEKDPGMGDNQKGAVAGAIIGGVGTIGNGLGNLGSSKLDEETVSQIKSMEEEENRLNEEEMTRQKKMSDSLTEKNEQLVKDQETFIARQTEFKKLMEDNFSRYKKQEAASKQLSGKNFTNEMLRQMKKVKEGQYGG